MNAKSTIYVIGIVLAILIGNKSSNGQDKKPLTISADIVSSYIWRGLSVNLSPNIQPSIVYNKNNLELGFWGSTNMTGTYKETDFWISYYLGNIEIGLIDYDWLFTKSFFNLESNKTNHLLEAYVNYIGKDIPFNFSLNSMIWGADKTFDNPTKNAYSTYAELGYIFGNINVFAGFTPWDGLYGDSYGRHKGFAVVNIGTTMTKEIRCSERLVIPVKVTVCINPQKEDIHFAFGITL